MTAGRKNVASLSRDWCTPPKYAAALREFFEGQVDLDPCSNEHSIVLARVRYQLPHDDGLCKSWDYATIYVNPPYGADRERGTTIKNWLRRCAEANVRHGSEVLALVPVATNTRHWKLYVWKAATGVAFLYDTRLRFLVDGQDGGKGAPMACAMVYWGMNFERFAEVFLIFGAVVDLRSLREKQVGVELSGLRSEASNAPPGADPLCNL
jgi:hypothetical protein